MDELATTRIIDQVTRAHVGLEVPDPARHAKVIDRWLRRPHVTRWWGPAGRHTGTLGQRSTDTHALITADRKPVGYMCWQKLSRAELEAAALTGLPEDLVDIDILIGEPDYLGCGVGPEALAVLLAKLHGEGVRWAGLATSTSNLRAIRAFEKAGFTLFKVFEDPDGTYRYMVAQLDPSADQAVATRNEGP